MILWFISMDTETQRRKYTEAQRKLHPIHEVSFYDVNIYGLCTLNMRIMDSMFHTEHAWFTDYTPAQLPYILPTVHRT
jgi:hypothetical protein